MNLPSKKDIFILILLASALLGAFKYVQVKRQQGDLLDSLDSLKAQVAGLEKEKQNLMQELKIEKGALVKLNTERKLLKNNLKASRARILQFFSELNKKQEELENLNSQILLLRAEDKGKAAKDIKVESKASLGKAKAESKQGALKTEVQSGPNQGFLIKDGASVQSVDKVKIEVMPITGEEK